MFAKLFRAKSPRHLRRVINPWFHGSEVAYYSPLPHGGYTVEHWGFGTYRDTRHGRAFVATEREARDFIAVGGRVPVRIGRPRRLVLSHSAA